MIIIGSVSYTHLSDLLLLIGARVSDRAIASPSVLEGRTKIIHIDVDPAEIGKNVGVSIPVVGDAKVILDQIAEVVGKEEHTDWVRKLTESKKSCMRDFDIPKQGCVNPKQFLSMLSDKAPSNTCLLYTSRCV